MAVRRPDGAWSVQRTAAGDWHPEEIKAAIRMLADGNGRRWSLERLARAHGLPAYACHTAIRTSDVAGEGLIAKTLGVSARDIWPSKYGKDGVRFNAGRRVIDSRASKARHHENRGAA